MLFVVPVVLFDMLKAKQLACVSESGQKCPAARSLSLRRAWIEIGGTGWTTDRRRGRSPYGERGLKYIAYRWHCLRNPSLSLRRAWIEIKHLERLVSSVRSLSLRRAWIEMTTVKFNSYLFQVALLTESVD